MQNLYLDTRHKNILSINTSYWLFTYESQNRVISNKDRNVIVYNYKCYEDLKQYTLINVFNKIHDVSPDLLISSYYHVVGNIYQFKSIECNYECINIGWTEINDCVFEEQDDFLIFIIKLKIAYKHFNFVVIEFDEFIKNKIKESQEKNPHKWLF